jgi:hypothetical protein
LISRELDDSSRALDGLNAVMIRKVLEDVTCESELCSGDCRGKTWERGGRSVSPAGWRTRHPRALGFRRTCANGGHS